MKSFRIVVPFLLASFGIAGCSPSTAVSEQPSDAAVKQANATRAAAVDERSDLTPEQKANLKRFQSGAGAPASGPRK